MKNKASYELDLAVLLDSWEHGLGATGTDMVSDFNLKALKKRLMDLYESYDSYEDWELEEELRGDYTGG